MLLHALLTQVAAYELLLRRMIRRAPDAALLSVAAFAWAYMEPWQPNRTVSDLNSEEQDQPPDGTLPSPYYYSGTCCVWWFGLQVLFLSFDSVFQHHSHQLYAAV
jgi:hypothetical protein